MSNIVELVVSSIDHQSKQIRVFCNNNDKILPSLEVDEDPMIVAKNLFESIFNTTAEWPRFHLADVSIKEDKGLSVVVSVMIPETLVSVKDYPGEWKSLNELKEEEIDTIRRAIRLN